MINIDSKENWGENTLPDTAGNMKTVREEEPPYLTHMCWFLTTTLGEKEVNEINGEIDIPANCPGRSRTVLDLLLFSLSSTQDAIYL